MKALPYYKEYYLNNCIIETKLYSGVRETLEFFRNKKIALVTNKPEPISIRILDILGVRQYFQVVIGPESVKNIKPDPEGLIKALEIFGEQPQKAVMVGDSYTDIQAGRSAGMHTCGVTYGLGSVEALLDEKPDIVLKEIIELKDFIAP